MKRILGSMVAVLLILGVPALASHTAVLADPDDFAGGDGSAEDPYQITDWNHLDNVRYNLSSYFILMNDLDAGSDGYGDLAGPSANSGAGWYPIAAAGSPFSGCFDGQGHEIRDLYINRAEQDYVGLFGRVAGGFIDSVGLVTAQVTGFWNVGA